MSPQNSIGFSKSCQDVLGFPKNGQDVLGVPRIQQESLGVARISQESLGVSRSPLESLGVPRSLQEALRVLNVIRNFFQSSFSGIMRVNRSLQESVWASLSHPILDPVPPEFPKFSVLVSSPPISPPRKISQSVPVQNFSTCRGMSKMFIQMVQRLHFKRLSKN